ncbi:MAG: hypothetical protein HN742_28605 [Lentisphaerae bacterium]|jgi:argininosuccinate lyase|nr:hypothetical protein [Lentisphaerota bacterium]MBT4817036.1 hypothetical protein [Lentisphaerota bacterium]MBT5612225.1 hypothetical protein [Lentisphaerota bacterium]MBT7845868.1 hypothetical protein [Lentisphaerota bacterium]
MTNQQKETSPAPDAELSVLERIDKVHEPGYMNWITASWAMMFIKQGIVPAKDAPETARVVLDMWENPVTVDMAGPHTYGADRHFIKTLGEQTGGSIMMARTQPSMRQMLEVRHELMKQVCRIYDLEEAIIDLAEKHAATIMPGYTHFRHAQPTTFGHYLLSVSDAIERSTKTLEHGCQLMSLNEMGCGALAGTSWPIDRDLVSQYLGMEGLIENANDAVCYTDGYLVVVAGLTNVTNIASRTALDLSYWSGVEYGFLDIGFRRGTSFMMPQKDGNPNSMEFVRTRAGQMLGHLTGVAAAGLRAPHGDVFEMLYIAEPTLAALKAAETCTSELTNEMRGLRVHEDRMLALIRESYIGATELANQMVRDHDVGYRTAHDIVHRFVVASREQGIPATRAQTELLDQAAEEVLGRKLGIAEERLRELLTPEHFINVTDSKGGIAPDEVARMIAGRRQELADARARHLKRIELLENAQEGMLSDLRGLCGA